MRDLLDVFVDGRPAPQGSKKFIGVGRPLIESSKRLKPWRDILTLTCWNDGEPYDGPTLVDLTFTMPRPTGLPKRWTPFAVKRPDIDKLARAVLDALSDARVWTDDSRVVDLHARKCVAAPTQSPGVHIIVRPCDDADLGEAEPS